ncbi:siphovirus Gp157 family protein [Rhizobium sp. RCAM05973]|uniref:siphovirus Gp157 family protein n=1 Tax=Rhizobium sp. RCAM05973 TaxID=2994066 RepID=UPI0022EC0199|nr:siphovirus Gp157 family protein [Rhizobium sp. RCAM05973]
MTKPANDNRQQQFLAADVANLASEIDAIFVAYPELAEDEQLRADMLEGETNLHSVLERLLTVEREANGLVGAVKARIDDLQARKSRAERRKDAMRDLMLKLLQAADLPRAPLTEATISVMKGRDSVHIVDEKAVPKKFLKVVSSPDKTAIKVALDAGKKVNGAVLKTGEPTLSVRAA